MDPETTLDVDLVAVEAAGEVTVLLDLAARHTVRGAGLVIRPADAVPSFTLPDELSVCGIDDGVMVELGDLSAGEHRRILLGFEVPDMSGLASVCELELRWVDLVDDARASISRRRAITPAPLRQGHKVKGAR